MSGFLAKKDMYVSLITLIIGAGIMASSPASSAGSPGTPVNLRCEYQAAPLGIDTKTPRFSWVVNDDRRGAVQAAYQVLVADDPDMLAKNQGNVWDSGQVESDQSVHVPYGGPALQSRRTYVWKVRTWDAGGQASPYSEATSWEMGPLSPSDWQARWIAAPDERPPRKEWPWGKWIWHPEERGIDKLVYFRKTFKLPDGATVKSATIKATADNYFTVYLNGQEIGKGTDWNVAYEFAAAPLLQPGENLVAVSAANNSGDVCGFILGLKVLLADGTEIAIGSDKDWKTATPASHGWTAAGFDDSGWGQPEVLAGYGEEPWGKVGHVYAPPRSALVRKEFKAKRKPVRARAYVTGLGCYELWINGQRVGQDIFTPGWTHYPFRIQYQTYDVTNLIGKGENAVGAVLGNAWWSGGLGWPQTARYSEGPLRLLMQLEIEYADGGAESIITDASWKTHASPIVYNDFYNGEIYDARQEVPGWNETGLADDDWGDVQVLDDPMDKLVAQQCETIQITQELETVNLTEPEKGVHVFDMGQNLVGWVRLKVEGAAGTEVRLRFAEVLQPDGNIYTENYRRAKATDTYILKGGGVEVWEPRFTYRGFRYVEVTGFPGVPEKDALTAQVLHSAAPVAGQFSCSNDLINSIYHNTFWGQRGNMHSVPTDCPQRDERLGWMGDAQIFSPTASLNMNMARFFSKWMHDITDSQAEDGAVTDVAPGVVVTGPAKPAWGDAVVIVPWTVYKYYGDTRVIKDNFEAMAAWIEYMRRHSEGDLYERDGYGDWIAVVPSPKKPISAAYYYYDCVLMSKMARAIGRESDEKKYAEMADRIAKAFNARFYDAEKADYEGGTQTAKVIPLHFGMVPGTEVPAVVENLVEDIRERDYHLSTGFLGTGYIQLVLSSHGFHDVAYRMAAQKTYPSWGYMVEKGATTIWELWDSDTKGPGMNSRNHFALGAVTQWFYEWLGGLMLDPAAPGYKRVIVRPQPSGDLKWARTRYESVHGPIEINWERRHEAMAVEVSLPANTSARVHVPTFGKRNAVISESGQKLVVSGKATGQAEGVQFIGQENGAAVFEVGGGKYSFVASNLRD